MEEEDDKDLQDPPGQRDSQVQLVVAQDSRDQLVTQEYVIYVLYVVLYVVLYAVLYVVAEPGHPGPPDP